MRIKFAEELRLIISLIENSRMKAVVLKKLSNSKQHPPLGRIFQSVHAFYWEMRWSMCQHTTLGCRSRTQTLGDKKEFHLAIVRSFLCCP